MIEPRLLGDRYELGDVLGRGGMAEVRRGRDRRLGRTVAIKMLRTDLAADPTFQVRFRREAQSAAMLNQPTIVAVYDTGEDILDGSHVPYIVMEYVEGKTLREMLREHPRITPERALEITSGILEALDYSHRAGIVHRDIKPGNVMLTRSGDVKVMDFGIARALSDIGATVTQTAAVVGTAQYLSPEQARGESADARSDLYSTGCLLYELLTGRPPFLGESMVSVAVSHVREMAVPPSQVDTSVPPKLDAIVMKALAKDRLERYQSAAEMRADVQRALAGRPVEAEAATTFIPAVAAEPATQAYAPVDDEAYTGERSARYDEEPEKKRGVGYGVLIAAIVLVLAVAAFAGYMLFKPSGDSAVLKAVPNVVGKTEDEARTLIGTAGLRVQKETAASAEVPASSVISQDPGPTQKLKADSLVTITVSSGTEKATVPAGLSGMQLSDAQNALIKAGLTPKSQPDENSTAPLNQVTAVTPDSGSSVDKGSAVTLTFSAGLVTVPNYVGQPFAQAQSDAFNLGLKVSVTEAAAAPGTPTGQVFLQSIPANTKARSGSAILLTYAAAAAPTTSPPTPTPTPSATPPPTPTASASPTPPAG